MSFSFRIVSRSPTAESDGDGVCPLFVPREDEPADEPEGGTAAVVGAPRETWELEGGLPEDDAVTGMDAGPAVRWGLPKLGTSVQFGSQNET